MATPSEIRRTFLGIAVGGVAAVLIVVALHVWLERTRFGASDQASVALIEGELRRRFDQTAEQLRALTGQIAARRDPIRAATADPAGAAALFDLLNSEIANRASLSTGITVYDPEAMPVAWVGRVTDLPRLRLDGAAALFVAQDALGPRLIRTEPILDRTRPSAPRIGTVVAEQGLEGVRRPVSTTADTFVVSDTTVPVSLRPRLGEGQQPSPYSFVIESGGQLSIDAWVEPSDLAAGRARWRSTRYAAIGAVAALTLILCIAPLIEVRRGARDRREFALATSGMVAILIAVRVIFGFASAPLLASSTVAEPLNLFVNALTLGILVWLTLDLVERRRLVSPRPRLLPRSTAFGWTAAVFFLAGTIDTVIVSGYERFLQGLVSRTPVDVLHFSLHPLNFDRAAIAFGLVLLHAAVIWGAALVIRVPDILRRRPRSLSVKATAIFSWSAAVVVSALVIGRAAGPIPYIPTFVALAVVATCAVLLGRPRGQLRRGSQAARIGTLYMALVLPAIAMYPSLQRFATETKEELIADQFGPQAINQRQELQAQFRQALSEIDALKGRLPVLVEGGVERDAPNSDEAFNVWSQTTLKESRLTSAVELYSANGQLVSRFALNLPEYGLTPYSAAGCRWVVFEEVNQFAATERHVLRASRDICEGTQPLGTIVVRVMLDYRALPLFSSYQRPSFESLSPDNGVEQIETAQGRDVEFVVYGWSRSPLYSLSTGVWPLADRTFDRMVGSRERFWETVQREDGATYRVYFLNDRNGIYALGYPRVTTAGHLINLAELLFLTAVVWTLLLGGATVFNALTSRTPASGRALLREVRSSFYRKLWLAFVAAAVVPVLILALATRTYFANQFTAGVEQDAVKTATVAQRLVVDYAALERGTNALQILDDQIMVLVGQAIDQDVNLFDPKRLQATSERDLFYSGLLLPRTPGDVYRRLLIDRLPSFVGVERLGGSDDSSYLVAAAPVRVGGREGIVTVPLTLRLQELDRQIDDLDRQVLFASVLFVLLGAGVGYWMAERIADPVNRLTRATRRIARGDLDARIAATSSDELRRLVEDFNRMAADLKRQRAELERTQRLEAWADMARQVAHDIKNPLTPIQLSAEHARRVNQDRGAPLSPVLDECVNAILTQVKLLRQISAEFSSFASSPTPRPEPSDLSALIEEVLTPYRAGLGGRVAIETHLDPDLPSISIDRTLFARALTNIIENALYAMPGGGTLTASSRQEAGGRTREAEAIVVTVSDTGVGMDEEALRKIFEPYFSTKATGTGLGLTIAKRNVTMNGGTISVESRRNAGTTVTIVFPVQPGGSPGAAPARLPSR